VRERRGEKRNSVLERERERERKERKRKKIDKVRNTWHGVSG